MLKSLCQKSFPQGLKSLRENYALRIKSRNLKITPEAVLGLFSLRMNYWRFR